MESRIKQRNVIDIRKIPKGQRVKTIFDRFLQLEINEELLVIADHDPEHLLALMKNDRIPVSVREYHTEVNSDGTYTGIFKKAHVPGYSVNQSKGRKSIGASP